MITTRMPDLLRVSYYAREPKPFDDATREAFWTAPSYRAARRILADRELVPGLTLRECVQVLDDLDVPLARVEIVPVGIGEAWRGEVVGQFPDPGANIRPDTPIRLYVSHPSMRDHLPEGMIQHPRTTGERDEGPASTIAAPQFGRFERMRIEEPPAARLLHVFQAACYRPYLELLRLEAAFDGCGQDAPLASALLSRIGCRPAGLEEDRLRWVGHFIWLLASTAGLETGIERLLRALLDLPLSIDRFSARPLPLIESQIARLGSPECRLGCDSVAGEALDHRLPDVELRLGPLSIADAARLVRSEPFLASLRGWADAMLPALRTGRFRFVVTDEQRSGTRLGETEPSAILGVTAALAIDAAAGAGPAVPALDPRAVGERLSVEFELRSAA